MDFVETDEQRELRKAVAELGHKYGWQYMLEKSKKGEKTSELWEEAGKLGFLGDRKSVV